MAAAPFYFEKVLIANRGEISVRIARTCKRLGIPTVAVYSSNDASSPHVAASQEAVCLGESYMDLPALLEAVRATKADAVHPGYGFLSENADFASAVEEAVAESNNDNDNNDNKPVTWLGPPPGAIVDMGCKLRSKDIAREAGVAIIPGCDDGALESVGQALEVIRDPSNGLEYPVLLKAAAGGGGKGMRICRSDRELTEGYPLAESEGLKFFADGRLLLEQYLEDPHHIEFQVVCSKRRPASSNSNEPVVVDVAIFVERECSVQRRNQKVVEESPSCLLTEETRRQMMEQTALLCQTVGYEGAGTVEWLVVDKKDASATSTTTKTTTTQPFYFLEMNTRLQVEHPVTEAVSHNVDLVEAMLSVGSGNGLPGEWYDKAELVEIGSGGGAAGGTMLVMPWEGHSIEGRIYAEDPIKGYLPSTGPLVPYKEPLGAIAVDDGSGTTNTTGNSYVRLDSGVVEGHVVTPFYDPMLSKIISYAPTREEAIEVLSDGLDSYVIEGVKHNAKLVQAVLRHPSFREGETPTSFLDEHMPDFSEYVYDDNSSLLSSSEEEELAVAIALVAKSREELLGRPPLLGAGGWEGRTVVVRPNGMFGSGSGGSEETENKNNPNDAFSVTLHRSGDNKNNNNETTISYEAHVSKLGDETTTITEPQRVIAVRDDPILDLERYLAGVTLDGSHRTLQVLGEDAASGSFRVQMHGAEYPACLVQSQREYELSRHMLPPVLEDTSDFVMSPMPGTLIGYSAGLAAGDSVETGQELCVVEAMKMQNIIRAPREGVIAKLCVGEGSALVTDQVILEFEPADGGEETDEQAA